MTIHHAWIQLKNKNGELIDVDIFPYINTIEELDIEDIINEITKHHEER